MRRSFNVLIFYKKMLNSYYWPYRLTARTHPSQGWNQSSILCRVTSRDSSSVLLLPTLKNKEVLGVPLSTSL